MKKRLISILLSLVMVLLFLPVNGLAAGSTGVAAVHIPDKSMEYSAYQNQAGKVYDLSDESDTKQVFDYTVPKGGLTVLIFFRDRACMNSDRLLGEITQTQWAKNDLVNIIAIESTNSGKKEVQAYMEKHDPSNVIDKVYYGNTGTAFWYAKLVEKKGDMEGVTSWGDASFSSAYVLLITEDRETKYIEYSLPGVDTIEYLNGYINEIIETSDPSFEDKLVTVTVPGTERYGYAQTVFEKVNEERSTVAAEALTLSDKLTKLAMQRAAELSVYYDHTRPNRNGPFSVNGETIDGSVVAYDGLVSENIAMGQSAPTEVMDAWMHSTMGHRENILDKNHTQVGVGCFENNGILYWVQLFGKGNDTDSPTAMEEVTKDVVIETFASRLDLTLASEYNITMNVGETVPAPKLLNVNKGNNNFSAAFKPVLSGIKNAGGDLIAEVIDSPDSETVSFLAVSAGTADVMFAAYEGQTDAPSIKLTVNGQVNRRELTESMFAVDTSAETYDGTAKTKSITSSLTLDTDYTVAYSHNTDAGTATITISGKGLYSGTLTYRFTINKATRVISATAAESTIYVGSAPSKIDITDNAVGENPTYTYSSDHTSVASVTEDGKVRGVAVGTAKITVSAPATANYAAGSASVSFTVAVLPLQEIAFKNTAIEKNYGDAAFTVTATNSSSNGGSVTYASNNESVATVDATSGTVTIKAAGKATITATAAGVEGVYAATDASYTLVVAKKAITVTADDKTMTYGETVPELTATVPALIGADTVKVLSLKLTTTATSASDVGDYEITGTGTSDNYIVTVASGKLTVRNANYAGTTTATVTAKVGTTAMYDLSALLPVGAVVGTPTALANLEDNTPVEGVTVSIKNGVLSFNIPEGTKPDTGNVLYDVVIPVTLKNYNDFNLQISVRAVSKDVPTLTVMPITKTYDGIAISSEDIVGTAMVGKKTVKGIWQIVLAKGQSIVNVADSGDYDVAFVADGYEIAYAVVKITINKATPTGTPTYTEISSPGKTLADVALTGSFTNPNSGVKVAGVLSWDLGDTTWVTEDTSYDWTFTPTDSANYHSVNGSVIPWVSTVTESFVDAPASAYYYDAVEWAVENGITSGTSATTFSPDAACTRAQAVSFLWRAAGSPAPKSSANPFADVSARAYYYDAVLWAVEKGITVGTSATTFSPDAACTRAHIVTFLWRAVGAMANGSNPFTDVADNAYYVDAVKWAVAEGVTVGTSTTTFSPDAICTRAQIVTFIYRYMAK